MPLSLNTKANTIFPEIVRLLQADKKVDLRVTGNSMFPFLRHGQHVVQLSAIDFSDIMCGDIVLIRRRSGAYILHRVVAVDKGAFHISGDAETVVEGPIMPDQLIAVVCKVKHGCSVLMPTDFRWKLYKRFYQKRTLLRKAAIRTSSLFHQGLVFFKGN